MKRVALAVALALAVTGCSKQQTEKTSAPAASSTAVVSGPFTSQELQQFAALGPIDTHAHAYQNAPEFYAMLKTLNLHILDILVDDDRSPDQKSFTKEKADDWTVVHGSNGYAVLCTTFNPFAYNQPNYARGVIRQMNQDFAQGAIAVKIWKNVGMEIKQANGKYLMPDDPLFQPIFEDIAAHHKTLVAHLADPDTIWEAPNPDSADYGYYTKHPDLYMYTRKDAPSKESILIARDHILQANPNLRVVGAHLGSMEANFAQLGQHLDKYPNFAVDLAARMPYVEMQPRADLIAFITKYQDRLIYGTDNELPAGHDVQHALKEWQDRYANDWRFFATTDMVEYHGHNYQGLGLPQSILHKLYHDNAVTWFPGILGSAH